MMNERRGRRWEEINQNRSKEKVRASYMQNGAHTNRCVRRREKRGNEKEGVSVNARGEK